jgi:hypothetical protein
MKGGRVVNVTNINYEMFQNHDIMAEVAGVGVPRDRAGGRLGASP